MASSRGSLPQVVFNQQLKYDTINEAFEKLSALAMGGVTGYLVNSPPGSPNEGETYIVGASPTGAWSGGANNIAHYYNGNWELYTPFTGLYTLRIDTGQFVYYNGSAWGNVV